MSLLELVVGIISISVIALVLFLKGIPMAAKKPTTERKHVDASETILGGLPKAPEGEYLSADQIVQLATYQRRKEFLPAAIAALAASPHHTAIREGSYDRLASDAVALADSIIAALEKASTAPAAE